MTIMEQFFGPGTHRVDTPSGDVQSPRVGELLEVDARVASLAVTLTSLEAGMEQWEQVCASCFSELRGRIDQLEGQVRAKQEMFAFDLAVKAMQNCSPEAPDLVERRTYEKAMLVIERCVDVALEALAAAPRESRAGEDESPESEAEARESDQGAQSEALGDRSWEVSAENG